MVEGQSMTQGKLIVFEGIDGCGKTTQARRLSESLTKDGIRNAVIHPLDDSEAFGGYVRWLIDRPDVHAETQMHAFAASLHYTITQQIIPALDNGINVICDRLVDSLRAYQYDVDGARELYRELSGLVPERRTYLIDTPVPDALSRIRGGLDAIELRGEEYYEGVRHEYLRPRPTQHSGIVVLDGRGSEDDLAARIYADAQAVIPD